MTIPPILHRGYRIFPGFFMPWEFVHEDYDGAPMYSDGPSSDNRYGWGDDVQACRDQIDELEDEA